MHSNRPSNADHAVDVTDQRESEGGRAEFGKKGGLKLNWCICEQETWGYS